jgi:maltose alpha-D-glucosyltransferase/alpha-amylase
MKFWLDQGASGFRVDMAASLVKNDPDKRETSAVWREIREWLDQYYPEACLVSEWSEPEQAIPAGFHMDFLLHFGSPGYSSLFRKEYGRWRGLDPYGFSFFNRHGHGNIMQFLDEYLPYLKNTREQGYISLITGNHDIYPRLGRGRDADELKVAFTFLMTMPGVPYIYYGDEIGMRGVDGLPSKEGAYQRTPSRTPMQWDGQKNAGFSTAPLENLYLPVDTAPGCTSVAAQEHDPLSLLNTVRRLIDLRKAHPALCGSGQFEPVYAIKGEYPFVYKRSREDEVLLVAVNPTEKPVEAHLPGSLFSKIPETLLGKGEFVLHDGGWELKLPGISSGVFKLS